MVNEFLNLRIRSTCYNSIVKQLFCFIKSIHSKLMGFCNTLKIDKCGLRLLSWAKKIIGLKTIRQLTNFKKSNYYANMQEKMYMHNRNQFQTGSYISAL